MPIQDGNYVAPEWVNGQPPAINASELNDISDTLASDWRRQQVLTPNTAQVFGLDGSATPDQVFNVIANKFGHTVNATVTIDGTPVEGVVVQGITTENGESCITDSRGKTTGICATDSTQIFVASQWLDVNDYKQTFDTSKVETDISVEISSRPSGKVEVTSSGKVKFSPARKTIQYFLVNGGTSGHYIFNSGNVTLGGSPGGNVLEGSFEYSGGDITVTIGSGGRSSSLSPTSNQFYISPNKGGNTSISGSFGTHTPVNTYIAPGYDDSVASGSSSSRGGNGGSGGGGAYATRNSIIVGNGGHNGSNGSDSMGGTGQGSTTFDGKIYAAGAGGTAYSYDRGFRVGSPGAGAGTNATSKDGVPITAGAPASTSYGSAAGSAMNVYVYTDRSATYRTTAGANGVVVFKWTT